MRLLIFLAALSLTSFVAADRVASCQSGWSWASNAEGQNPCEVAGIVDAACRGISSYNFTALEKGYTYINPTSSDPDSIKCECNTVIFNLVMACTACQNASVVDWAAWSEYCTTVLVSKLPGNIPNNTGVPHWAYLDTSTGSGNWNGSDAEAAGDSPESTNIPQQEPTPPSTSYSHPNQISIHPGPSNTGSPNTQNKAHTSIGAIFGGTVGGLLVLVLVTGAILV